MELSIFQNFTSRQVGTATMEEVADMIRSDERLKALTEAYRATGSKSVKTESPLFAVACRFQGGKARANVTSLTGLSLVDIDHIGDAGELRAAKLKIQADPHTLLCYTTVSGRGLRVIFRYRLEESATLERQVRLYARAFETGNLYYEQLLGLEADRQCKNVTRLSGLAHDPEAYFNAGAVALSPMPPESPGTPSRDFTQACRRARRTLERTEQFREGNHHNYLVRLLFRLAERGVPEAEATDFLAREFADYHGEDFASLAASCYRTARESVATRQATERPTRAELIVDFLRTKPLRYDVLSRKIQIQTGADWTDLTDRMANDLLYDCNRRLGMNVSKAAFLPMLMSAQVPEVNPLREYIGSLPPWDGQTDYIALAAAMVKTGDDALWLHCFRKWLCAMVASWMRDDVVNHQVLVLIGPQGIFKTTWLDALMPPCLVQYRSKQSAAGHMDKDELLRATEFGLINMDEIDRMSESELNQLKSLITATDVNVRSPYAYGKERRLRVASYVASGNKERFLTDQTGNRRWLPFRVEQIDSPFLHPLPHEGMYAQAWALVQEGFDYWFSLQDIRQLEGHVESFAVETSEQQLLPVYFRPCPAGTPGALFLTVAEISAKLTMYGNLRRPMDVRQLGTLLRKMGYEPKRSGPKGQRGYIVQELSADAINASRKINAQ